MCRLSEEKKRTMINSCSHLWILQYDDCLNPSGQNNLVYEKWYCQRCRNFEYRQGTSAWEKSTFFEKVFWSHRGESISNIKNMRGG